MRRFVSLLAALIAALLIAAPVLAQGRPLAEQVRDLAHHAEEGSEAAKQNKPELMQAEYLEIHTLWESFEDAVSAQDPAGYAELEEALGAIKSAVDAQPLDQAAVRAAYEQLEHEAIEVADRLAALPAGADVAEAAPAVVAPADLLRTLAGVAEQIERGDAAGARAAFDGFIRSWPAAEDQVATRSDAAYRAIEAGMGRVAAALRAEPANLAAAATGLAGIQAALAPFAERSAYSAADAAFIILREGLEALLVIVALLAFLQKSGNQSKRGWIWVGGALGVAASLIVALLLQALFSSISAGRNRELIEGITGLLAAGLLFYVSYWLHSKASLRAWQQYIGAQTTRALARGSLFGLAMLSFLAVFREGAETAVFYLGMAPAIAMQDLLLGIGIGVAVLVVCAVLMLVVGVRLPLRLFFLVAGLLVYYLGFKFVGTGIHALQVAGYIPTSPIGSLASSRLLEFFGIYLTWQTVVPQLVLLAAAIAVVAYLRAQDRRYSGLGGPAAA